MRPSSTHTLPQSTQMRYSASPVSPPGNKKQRLGDDAELASLSLDTEQGVLHGSSSRSRSTSSSAAAAKSPADDGMGSMSSFRRGAKRPAAPEQYRHKSSSSIGSSSIAAANAEKVDMLAALASVSTMRQSAEQEESHKHKHVRHHDYTLRAYSLSATKQASNAQTQTAANSKKSSIARTTAPSANYQSMQLTLDPRTNLPPRDIIDELLQHVELEFNVISKVVHPKAFMAQYSKGKCSTFLLLAVMANNVMFSSHPAIVAMGAVAAGKVFVDRAKLFAPEAFENPSLAGCQALLLLALAYMHQGMLSVSSHYSSATLKILDQLGVCKIDDDAWGNEDDWISGSSWLDREQIRRLIWGSFSIDTFLSLMMHKSPYVMIDLSGVNRPCAPTMWYVGNDSIDTLNFPASALAPNPNDTAYVTALKKIKVGGVSWRINGNTVQLNFAMLGNAIMRGIMDPHYSKEHLDKLVVCAYKSLSQWVTAAPEMPDEPTFEEVNHTLFLCSAALCLKSVVAPYLITRGRKAADRSSESNSNKYRLDIRLTGQDTDKNTTAGAGAGAGANAASSSTSSSSVSEFEYMRCMFDAIGDLNSPSTLDRLLTDYVRTSFQMYRYMRLTASMIENNSVPPMFLAHSTMITGGIFAACAHASPTQAQRDRFARCRDFVKWMLRDTMRSSLLFRVALEEVEKVEEMVQFMPRRLDPAHLETLRDTLVPETIEAVVNKRFCQFIEPIRQMARMQSPPMSATLAGTAAASETASVADSTAGVGAGDNSGKVSSSSCLGSQLGLSLSLFGPSKIGSLFCPRMSGSGLSSSLSALFGRSCSSATASSMSNPPGRNGNNAISRSATAVSDIGSDMSETAFSDRNYPSPPPAAQYPQHQQHPHLAANHSSGFSTDKTDFGGLNSPSSSILSSRQAKAPPDYKLTFTAISSLLLALSIASKDETFFEKMFESMDKMCKMASPAVAPSQAPKSEEPLSSPPMRPSSTLSASAMASSSSSSYLVRGSSNGRAVYSGAPSQIPPSTAAWMRSGNNSAKDPEGNQTPTTTTTATSSTTTASLYSSASPPPRLQPSKSLSPDMRNAPARTSASGGPCPSSLPSAASTTSSSPKQISSIGDLLN
ncbi:hypothetical protein LPJ64_005391 [Coemansia asiatica]|uniref:Xylanolytic transcriptional activator regulatory domain-containing protein n=1 Tax=Coemansia asiatica TaxID=1052880 RepID=A0A9W7XGK3_9FUNG|nr:hypothetical protein LPJ64_005391 [Coemansia asiatica]